MPGARRPGDDLEPDPGHSTGGQVRFPACKELAADGERDNRFVGTLQAQAGPMRVNLSGSVQILGQDAEKGEAQLLLEASDRRLGGSVRVNMETAHNAEIGRSDGAGNSYRHGLYGKPGNPGPANNPPQSRRRHGRVRQEFGGVGGRGLKTVKYNVAPRILLYGLRKSQVAGISRAKY